MVRILSLLILIASLASCGEGEKSEEQKIVSSSTDTVPEFVMMESNDEDTGTPKHALLNTYNFKTGTSLIVVEKKRSSSQSLITVQGTGFSDSQDILTFRNADPIEETHIADLDGDGYDELYILTRSIGSGSRGNIIGVASIRDKTYQQIQFEQFAEGDPNFEGYRGVDRFRLKDGELMRDMPIFRESDPNGNPSGGVRTLTYDLERVDGELRLVVQ